MFLKNNLRTSGSIRAKIVTFASYAVMTGAECALAPKAINVTNPVRNKHILCFSHLTFKKMIPCPKIVQSVN